MRVRTTLSWMGIRLPRGAGLVCLSLLFFLESTSAQEPDHTTYVVRSHSVNTETRDAIEAVGGVIDHFDGTAIRAYILHDYWEAFLAASIPYTLESVQPIPRKQRSSYPSFAEVSTYLNDTANAHPEICRLISIGRSVQDREIWALLISDNPSEEEEEPEVAYISTMHGDETVGTVLNLNLIDLLVNNYETNTQLTQLVDETEIWIVPLLNPDGYEMGIRWNANNTDLNRAFPIWESDFEGTFGSDGTPETMGREPEVVAIMEWATSNAFVLAANFHTGALVVNYLYDQEPGISSGQDAPTLDDPLMRSLSTTYAVLNAPMLASRAFPGGITNGSAWFSNFGGMQDWHYRYAGAIHATIELSNTKDPNPNTLLPLWDDNREAMIAYLERVHAGIRGRVTDRITNEALFATLTLDDNPQAVYTDPGIGDYYRLTLPGTYTLQATAPGYIPYTMSSIAVAEESATQIDISLSKGDVNGDGMVNATDLQLVINTILGRTDEVDADVDGNGVSATDLQQLVNQVLRRG